MKKQTLTTLISGAIVLMAAGPLQAEPQYGARVAPIREHYHMKTPRTVLESLEDGVAPAPVRYLPKHNYEDLMGGCEDSIRDLRVALRQADMTAHTQPSQAAQTLLAALVQKAAELRAYDNGNTAIPNTIVAVEIGAGLSQTFVAGSSQMQMAPGVGVTLRPATLALIQYNFVRSMVNMALKVHSELDKSFFEEIASCYGDRCFVSEFSDDDYADHLGAVVHDLISVYQVNRERMATDYFNLTMAQQFSQAAAELLSESMFRRNYRHAILNFAETADIAQSALQNGGYQTVAQAMHFVDSRIDETISRVRTCEEPRHEERDADQEQDQDDQE